MKSIYKLLTIVFISIVVFFSIDLLYYFIKSRNFHFNSVFSGFILFFEIFLLTYIRKYFMSINFFLYLLVIMFSLIFTKQFILVEVLQYKTGNSNSFFDLLNFFIQNPSFKNFEYLILYIIFILFVVALLYAVSHFILSMVNKKIKQ